MVRNYFQLQINVIGGTFVTSACHTQTVTYECRAQDELYESWAPPAAICSYKFESVKVCMRSGRLSSSTPNPWITAKSYRMGICSAPGNPLWMWERGRSVGVLRSGQACEDFTASVSPLENPNHHPVFGLFQNTHGVDTGYLGSCHPVTKVFSTSL